MHVYAKTTPDAVMRCNSSDEIPYGYTSVKCNLEPKEGFNRKFNDTSSSWEYVEIIVETEVEETE